MPLTVTCPSCRNELSVPDSAVGLQGRCPMCGNLFTVAAPPPAPSPSATTSQSWWDDSAAATDYGSQTTAFDSPRPPSGPSLRSSRPPSRHDDRDDGDEPRRPASRHDREDEPRRPRSRYDDMDEPRRPASRHELEDEPRSRPSSERRPKSSPAVRQRGPEEDQGGLDFERPAAPRKRKGGGGGLMLVLGGLFLLGMAGAGIGGLLWWLSTREPPAPVTPLHFVAGDAHFVMEVDMPAVRGSRWHADLVARGAGLEAYHEAELRQLLGIDLGDVTRLTIAGQFGNHRKTVLVVQTNKALDAGAVLGEQREEYGEVAVGKKAVLYDRKGDAVYLPDKHMLVRGPTDVLSKAVKRNGPAAFAQSLQAAWDETNPEAPARMALALPSLLRLNGGEAVLGVVLTKLAPALAQVQAVSIQGKADDQVELIATLHGGEPAPLRADIEAGLTQLRAALGLAPEEARFLDGVQVALVDGTLKLRWVANAEVLTSALKRWKRTRPDHWINLLDSTDLAARNEAVKELVRQGGKVVPRLARELESGPARRREVVMAALGDIGADAAAAAGPMAKLIKDAPGPLRLTGVRALGKIGPKARTPALPVLLPLLADAHEETRLSARQALDRLAPFQAADSPVLEQAFRQTGADARVRRYAFEKYAEVTPPARAALPTYLAGLRDSDRDVRLRAVRLLAKAERGALADVYPTLLERMTDSDGEVQTAARATLTALGPPPVEMAERLGRLLGDERAVMGNRLAAAEALKQLGRAEPRTAFRLLARELTSSEKEVRQAVVAALGGLGPPGRDDLKQLSEMLRRDTLAPEVMTYITRAMLMADGASRGETIALVVELLERNDPAVQKSALEALKKLGPFQPAEAGTFRALLKKASAPADVRALAARTLGEMGAAARAASGDLVLALRDPDKGVKLASLEALGKLAPAERDVVDKVALLYSSGDPEVRQAVLTVMPSLKAAGGTLGPLLRGLGDREAEVVKTAEDALKKHGPGGKGDLADLREAMKRRNPLMRKYALDALAGLGADALPALDELRQAITDPEKQVAQASIRTVAALGPAAADAAPELEEALGARDAQTKMLAAATLVPLGKGNATVTMPLVLKARSEPPPLGEMAKQALRTISPSYKDAAADLARAYRKAPDDADLKVAVKRLQEPMLPYLVANLDTAPSRYNAAACLATLELLPELKVRSFDMRKGVLDLRVHKGVDPKIREAADRAWRAIQ